MALHHSLSVHCLAISSALLLASTSAYGWDNPQKIILVDKNSEWRCIFEHASALKAGQHVPLTLTSHAGLAVIPLHEDPHRHGQWEWYDLGVGQPDQVQHAQMEANFILIREEGNTMALNIHNWRYDKGSEVNKVNGRDDGQTKIAGGGRDFQINDDGSISPVKAPHLALGTPRMILPNATVASFCFAGNGICNFVGAEQIEGSTGNSPPAYGNMMGLRIASRQECRDSCAVLPNIAGYDWGGRSGGECFCRFATKEARDASPKPVQAPGTSGGWFPYGSNKLSNYSLMKGDSGRRLGTETGCFVVSPGPSDGHCKADPASASLAEILDSNDSHSKRYHRLWAGGFLK